jgi:hypothetical protein
VLHDGVCWGLFLLNLVYNVRIWYLEGVTIYLEADPE